MDWATAGMIGIPAIAGGLASFLGADANNKQAKQQAKQYEEAIAWLKAKQQLPTQGFYGSAGPNWYGATGCWTAYQGGIPGYPNTGVTTGNVAYDNAVRAMTQQQLGQQLAAARLNADRGNMTDAQARAAAFAQQEAMNKAINDRAMNQAARAAIRQSRGTRDMGALVAAGRQNALAGSNVARANSMNVQANNNANFQFNPMVQDAQRQANNYLQRQQAYNGMIAQMNGYKPTEEMSGGSAAISGLLGGLTQGMSNYAKYGGK